MFRVSPRRRKKAPEPTRMHNTTQTANRVLAPRGALALLSCIAALAVALAAPGAAPARPKRPGKGHGAAPKVGLMTFTGPGEAASRAAVETALTPRPRPAAPAP